MQLYINNVKQSQGCLRLNLSLKRIPRLHYTGCLTREAPQGAKSNKLSVDRMMWKKLTWKQQLIGNEQQMPRLS